MQIDNYINKKISKYLDINKSSNLILKTTNKYNIENSDKYFEIFINLELINNIRRINKFHESVNLKLDIGNYYVTCSETLEERRKRVWEKTPSGLKNLVRVFDFIYKRVYLCSSI